MNTKRNAEDVLASTKEECLRGIANATEDAGRKAWYYTHCGEIEMAYNLGLLTLERFDELRSEWSQHRPV